MILPRSHTWMHLLPSSSAFRCADGVPEWFRAPLRPRGEGGQILVTWGRSPTDRTGEAEVVGRVVVNDRFAAGWARDAGYAHVRDFAVLPSLEHPRWFIPLDSPTVSSAAFCLYTPFRLSARLKLVAARAAFRAGVSAWLRNRICIALRRPSPLAERLQWLFPGRPIALALSTGAEGPDFRRKPSVAVLGSSGIPLAFAKVAGSPVAAELLRHEALILPALAERPQLRGLTPRLLWAGDVDGAYVLAQSPIRGRPVGPRWTPAHGALLDAFGAGGELKPASASGLVASLRRRAERHPDLADALRDIGPTLQRTRIVPNVSHTDLVPWNLRDVRGDLAAFDWDTAELDGLPFFDHWHHDLMVGYCLQRWTVERGAAALAIWAEALPRGLDAGALRALQVVYLAHGVERMIAQGHADGHPMVRWYRHLLQDALSAHARAVPGRGRTPEAATSV